MDNFYTQQVTQPTRGTAVLDLVITSEPDVVDELLVFEGLGSSDHSMLLWTWQFGKKEVNWAYKVKLSKANLDKIKSTLSSSDWDRLLKGKIETAWNNFKNLILSLVDANVPKMKVSGTKKCKPV